MLNIHFFRIFSFYPRPARIACSTDINRIKQGNMATKMKNKFDVTKEARFFSKKNKPRCFGFAIRNNKHRLCEEYSLLRGLACYDARSKRNPYFSSFVIDILSIFHFQFSIIYSASFQPHSLIFQIPVQCIF